MRSFRKRRLATASAALVVLAAGCGSSSHSSASSASRTYTIGLLTDQTGLLANSEASAIHGLKGAIGMFDSEGYHLKYVSVDTGSSPTGALTAARTLVEQDHAFAVDLESGVAFAAEPYLASKAIPVIGTDTDGGTQWVTNRNFFSDFGSPNFHQVESTTGSLLKLLGAANFAAIGYSISPSSSNAAKGAAASAQLAGIKVGYLNTSYPFGSTNVTPAVIAMKNAGVDSFDGAVEQSTSLAIVAGLRQRGVVLKAPLLSVGYNDLKQEGAATEAEATGAYYTLSYEPIELNTAATQRLAKAMQTYAGVPSDEVDETEYDTFISVDSFVAGLKLAGPNPTPAQFVNAMLKITNYNAGGLYGTHSIGFAMDQRAIGTAGADNCLWLLKFNGSSYGLVTGAEPICGTVIRGKTI